MASVTGFGGFFFRARDPKALAAWYETHLGILQVPNDYDTPPWQQDAGPTVFAPFSQDTGYFGDPEKMFMFNFRVDDLDAVMTELRAAGIEVSEYDESPLPNGRFAKLNDPEGNPIELWEPVQSAVQKT